MSQTRPETREQVKTWLLEYAWLGSPQQQAAEVECILAQDDWKFVDVRAEKFAGQAEVPGPEAFDEAYGFALSELYECHDGPHIDTCPHAPKGGE
jgi:hypothetical protein